MPKLNWRIIASNIAEAREQLQAIEQRVEAGELPNEAELEIAIRHAYHHLNCAWNVRHTSTKRYASLSDDDFREWGRFPQGLDSASP